MEIPKTLNVGEVLTFKWRSSRDTIGFVAIKSYGGWKAYMGVGEGFSEESDIRDIKDHGIKMMKHEAIAFFPELNPDEFKS